MPDPTAPGWRAEYTGTDPGNVGSGERLGTHLYYLYRAGRNELPGVAAVYGELTRDVHHVAASMRAIFDLPGWGMETSHQRLLELRDEVHDVLRQTCLRMREAGAALVATADDYASSDEAAAAAFNRLLDEYADDYAGPPPHVPDPPAVHDPPAPPPQTERGFFA